MGVGNPEDGESKSKRKEMGPYIIQLRIKVKYKTKADLIEYLSSLVERFKDEVFYPALPLEADDPFCIQFGNRGKRIWLTCEKKGKKQKDEKEQK